MEISSLLLPETMSAMSKLRTAGWVFIGQLTGGFCAVVVVEPILIASFNVFPILRSSRIPAVLTLLLVAGATILGSRECLKRYDSNSRPWVVSICGFVVPVLLLIWIARHASDDIERARALIFPGLIALPLGSILGAYLGTYVRPKLGGKAG